MAMKRTVQKVFSIRFQWIVPTLIFLCWTVSCSAMDDAIGGNRAEGPSDAVLKTAPSASATQPPGVAASSAPSPQTSSPAAGRTESPSEADLLPIDKAIAEDCPERALSKNVPKAACSTDQQCGDGFCDRGRCAAIWTCNVRYSKHCERDAQCGTRYLCIQGRCSSCISDSECMSTPNNLNPSCVPYPTIPGAVGCYGTTPHTMGVPERGPLQNHPPTP